ncbi:MAG: NAD(P)/FAD-dependent oxidoreductase [Bacteroidales bacterium]
MKTNIYQVAIIGGGPAGLSAALVFGRSLINSIVISEEKPRNRITKASHGFITRDGIHPTKFLEIAKNELKAYPSIHYLKEKAKKIEEQKDFFIIHCSNKTKIYCEKIIISTGLKDNLDALNIKNIHDSYGKSTFVCPLCDGWEWQGKALALIGEKYSVYEYSKVLKNWSDNLIVFTNGHKILSPRMKQEFMLNNISFYEEKINAFHSKDGNLNSIELSSKKLIKRDAAFIPHQTNNNFKEIIGVDTIIKENSISENQTNLPFQTLNSPNYNSKIFIIGDAKNGFSGLTTAASEAYQTAKQIIYDMSYDKWQEIKL